MKCLWTMATGLLLAVAWPAVQAEQPVGCIDVSVGGYKAPNYECLSQQMGNNANGAAAEQRNQATMDEAFNKKSPSQKGLATPAATSVRMGNTFGTSVKPQRPPVNNGGSSLIKAP